MASLLSLVNDGCLRYFLCCCPAFWLLANINSSNWQILIPRIIFLFSWLIFFAANFLLCILNALCHLLYCLLKAWFYINYCLFLSLPTPFSKCLLCFCVFRLDFSFWTCILKWKFQVCAIQSCGGQMTVDGRRFRTGGGILWNIMKTREPMAYKEIMKKAKEFEVGNYCIPVNAFD